MPRSTKPACQAHESCQRVDSRKGPAGLLHAVNYTWHNQIKKHYERKNQGTGDTWIFPISKWKDKEDLDIHLAPPPMSEKQKTTPRAQEYYQRTSKHLSQMYTLLSTTSLTHATGWCWENLYTLSILNRVTLTARRVTDPAQKLNSSVLWITDDLSQLLSFRFPMTLSLGHSLSAMRVMVVSTAGCYLRSHPSPVSLPRADKPPPAQSLRVPLSRHRLWEDAPVTLYTLGGLFPATPSLETLKLPLPSCAPSHPENSASAQTLCMTFRALHGWVPTQPLHTALLLLSLTP